MWMLVACLLLLCVSGLLLYLFLMKRTAAEIARQMRECAAEESHAPILVSLRERSLCALAAEANALLERLDTARRRFEDGDKALKEAVTNISHDLRTPLTAVCGYLDLLEQEEMSEDAARYLALIRERTDRLRTMSEEFFRYAVLTAPDRAEPCVRLSLGDALAEAVAGFYAVLTERSITPELSLPDEAVTRTLPADSLARVFENILSNALKYSAGDLRVALDPDGTVSFSNTAPQLDEVQTGRLFDRYFTVETGRRATGLGLSIAKHLTERMGGDITAAYRAGRLVITLHFPPASTQTDA